MPDCPTINCLLGPFVYGDLASAEHARVEAHLLECPACRAEVVSYRAVLGRISPTLFESQAPSRDQLLARVAAAQAAQAATVRREAPARRAAPGNRALGLVPAVALALMVALVFVAGGSRALREPYAGPALAQVPEAETPVAGPQLTPLGPAGAGGGPTLAQVGSSHELDWLPAGLERVTHYLRVVQEANNEDPTP
jgi:anti-sigma factor RsiW